MISYKFLSNAKNNLYKSAFCSFVKSGFTLAEVLITLGIIGVVAAITLPTLIQNNDEKATVTKLKKMYSNLQNAYALYRAEDHPVVVPAIYECCKTLRCK